MTSTQAQESLNWVKGLNPTDSDIRAPRFDIPYPTELWSEVLPNLYQGGTDDEDIHNQFEKPMITKKDFDTVVTAYAWANPVDWFVKEIRFCFYDSTVEGNFDPKELMPIVESAHYDWKNGKRVLIRCQAGLNRSGLITALILMRDGYTAEEAIQLLRKTRSGWVLFNGRFEKWLLEQNLDAWRD